MLKKDFEAVLPELRRTYDLQKTKPVVKFLEGKEGIRFALNDIVDSQRRGDKFYRYSSKKSIMAAEKYMPRDWRARRDAKQLQREMITDDIAEWQKKNCWSHFHRLLPPDSGLLTDNIAEVIYGDKVAFADFDSEVAIIIEDALIADFQKKLFRVLYRLLKSPAATT